MDQTCTLPASGNFFDTSAFPPRWHCGSWSPLLGWLTILSELTIAAAYFAIPLAIVFYVRRRRGEVPFPHLFWLFSIFIVACGSGHLVDAIIFWWPIYPVAALIYLATAAASLAAVVATVRVLPVALTLPGLATVNRELRSEIAARSETERALRQRGDELQESQDRLIAAQRAAHIGDWSWDAQAGTMRWSEELYRLFERDPALGPPPDPEAHSALYVPAAGRTRQDVLARVAQGQANASVDLEVVLPSGRACWYRCIIRADRAPDGALRRLWGTVQDITVAYQEARAKEQQHQDLLRINAQLEQFAYIASHDLLEPLRKVRFFADVVAVEAGPRLGETADDALQRLVRATERMHRLVIDLLAFARAGKSLATVGRVELAGVVAEAVEGLEVPLRETGGACEITDLPTVAGERGLLLQVFANLLSNSLRYRHPARPPRIWVQGAVEGREAVIAVSDNGLGFDPEQSQRLFEPFVRLHPEAGHAGTGIGLAICRRIVEAHRGSIEAVPLPESGACFTIRLPLPGDDHA